MKTIIRRFSRVTDSTRYLRFVSTHNGTDSSAMKKERKDVPYGYLPVYVGDEMERFVVNTQCLNHPIFMLLLNRSKQVYGYSQPGALHIPCKVSVFERVLEVIENGSRVVNLDEIVQSFLNRFCNIVSPSTIPFTVFRVRLQKRSPCVNLIE